MFYSIPYRWFVSVLLGELQTSLPPTRPWAAQRSSNAGHSRLTHPETQGSTWVSAFTGAPLLY